MDEKEHLRGNKLKSTVVYGGSTIVLVVTDGDKDTKLLFTKEEAESLLKSLADMASVAETSGISADRDALILGDGVKFTKQGEELRLYKVYKLVDVYDVDAEKPIVQAIRERFNEFFDVKTLCFGTWVGEQVNANAIAPSVLALTVLYERYRNMERKVERLKAEDIRIRDVLNSLIGKDDG